MCCILDASCFGEFFDPKNTDMKPLREWLNKKNGKLAYSPTEKLKKECEGNQNFKELLAARRRAGKAKTPDANEVHKKTKKLERKVKSNDAHIIALAMVSGAKLLVTHDVALMTDFKRLIKDGRIYRKKSHKHLLTPDTCP